MNLREIIRFAKAISQGGPSLEDVLKKEKKPCIYVGMVCVWEAYQGQGYMRKVMLLCMERTDMQKPPGAGRSPRTGRFCIVCFCGKCLSPR